MESGSIKKRFLAVLLAFMVAFYIPVYDANADGTGNVDNGGGLADTMNNGDGDVYKKTCLPARCEPGSMT